VTVAPERLAGWLDGFSARHGAVECTAGADLVTVRAADGALAACEVPFPPLVAGRAPWGGLVEHALVPRTLGVLLVRLGGHAAGVFAGGAPALAARTGSRPVHGRAAAGGWSQHRFARRREGQARTALQAAADTAAEVLLPSIDGLDAVVTGGDRRALETVLADPRLAPLRPLLAARVLEVPDPRRRVLEEAAQRARDVWIRLIEPIGDPAEG
jgi:hypothetical protein